MSGIPQKNPEVIHRELDDEAVLVLPGEGQVLVLNVVASLVWSLIDGVAGSDAMSEAVTQAFKVDSETARHDTTEFLQTLAARGAIIYH